MTAKSVRSATETVTSDERIQTALKLLVTLVRAYNSVVVHLENDIKSHGLTQAEFGVLEMLFHTGPQLLGEIQRKILVSSGGITFVVDKLAAKGLVERQDCPTDRRARYAALTPAGEKLIARIFPGHAERVASVMATLGPTQQKELTRLLRELGQGAQELAP